MPDDLDSELEALLKLPPDVLARSLAAHVVSLTLNNRQLQTRVRILEKLIDTLNTPAWKRLLFRLDGWPPWYRLAQAPAWRPWRRWWRS